MLERLGFKVLVAADGRSALEVFHEHSDSIVCVLLDLTMPQMDGEETFQAMRDHTADATVILCSGYNERESTQRFTGKGLAGFLQKPYSLTELRTALRSTLENQV